MAMDHDTTVEATAPDLLAKVAHAQNAGRFADAAELLASGMARFPEKLDQYGHPLFHKELLRLLLNAPQWEKAERLIPGTFGLPPGDWHEILVARAYARAGAPEAAFAWWEKVVAKQPFQPEARKWLQAHPGGKAPAKPLAFPAPFDDMIARVPGLEMRVIFDVGANHGQSCTAYAAAFPQARIMAFEPAPASFAKLSTNVGSMAGLALFNMALGEEDGGLDMHISGTSAMNRVVRPGEKAQATQVRARRMDSFCAEYGVDHIDFLKIDTEGHDLAVLRGCGDFLPHIDFIQCEASANRYNSFHNAYAEIFAFMTENGFHLFKIYGQAFEWGAGGLPLLRRFDPVFINQRVVGSVGRIISV
jgi:FkbM family methyltransferase